MAASSIVAILFIRFIYLFGTAIVRRLAGDGNVMRMTLQDTGIGNTGKLGIVQTLDSGSATVAHARTQTADELVNHLLDSALLRYTASDTLGYQFLRVGSITLKVAVLRTVLLLHGLKRAHTAVALELTPVKDDGITRTFLGTGYE